MGRGDARAPESQSGERDTMDLRSGDVWTPRDAVSASDAFKRALPCAAPSSRGKSSRKLEAPAAVIECSDSPCTEPGDATLPKCRDEMSNAGTAECADRGGVLGGRRTDRRGTAGGGMTETLPSGPVSCSGAGTEARAALDSAASSRSAARRRTARPEPLLLTAASRAAPARTPAACSCI